MEGYLLNKSTMWVHAMKKAIGPGAKVPLQELYDQYGKKHDLAKGDEFIGWLKAVKLRDDEKWVVVTEQTEEPEQEDTTLKEVRIDVNKVNPKKMSIEDVVSLSVRQARELVPKILDVKLLKYSHEEARPRAGKDSLCRILKKRITELETQRR